MSTGDSDEFEAGRAALDQGDVNGALIHLTRAIEADSKNVAAHLMVGRCFAAARRFPQAIQVYSALVLRPELRDHAELPVDELDSLVTSSLLGWAADIERAGFPQQHLDLFSRSADFYLRALGRHTVEIVGLTEGLKNRFPVGEIFAERIREKMKPNA